jgi:hypothetical protein
VRHGGKSFRDDLRQGSPPLDGQDLDERGKEPFERCGQTSARGEIEDGLREGCGVGRGQALKEYWDHQRRRVVQAVADVRVRMDTQDLGEQRQQVRRQFSI